jgi:hypothetical protein
MNLEGIFDTEDSVINECDTRALFCVIMKNKDKLDTEQFNPNVLVRILKNDLRNLEFLLSYLDEKDLVPHYEESFFTNIRNPGTFNIYKKYCLWAHRLKKDVVGDTYWSFLRHINYITLNQYKSNC